MGHSGSGKTENARHILNYLFKVTSQVSSNVNCNLTGECTGAAAHKMFISFSRETSKTSFKFIFDFAYRKKFHA